MLSWELKQVWGENCSKNRKIRAKVDSRTYGAPGDGLLSKLRFHGDKPLAISVIINMSNHYDFHKDKIVVTLTVR